MSSKLAVVQNPPTNQGASEELVRRARQMIPELIARQAETEARTYYAPDTHEAFEEAGFYDILVPKVFGGLDLDVKTYYRVVMALTEGCPSTGWQYCLGACHAVTLCGIFDFPTQRQILENARPFICPITARPIEGAKRLPNGDWQIDGVFSFGSGIPYSTHFMSHAIVLNDDRRPTGVITFVAPRSEYTILDDWGDALGLKGSGSHSARFDNVRLPAAFVRENVLMPEHRLGPKSEATVHLDNAVYYGGTMSLWLLEPAAMTLGMVKGALDECAALMGTKKTAVPPIVLRSDNSDYQRWFGLAAAKIATAEAAFYDACDKWTEDARLNMLGLRDPGDPREMTSSVMCGEIIEMCWDAMQLLYRVAGTGEAFDGRRMQRIYRDLSTSRSHAYNTRFDQLYRDLSQLLVQRS